MIGHISLRRDHLSLSITAVTPGLVPCFELLKATVAERAIPEQQLRVVAENLHKSNICT